MAVKDHSLDEKIIEAARAEFMAQGFRQASLRKIAERAGITTGALYTRYKSKDVLFTSLVEDVMHLIGRKAQPIGPLYRKVLETRSPEDFLAAMNAEISAYLDVLFDQYDQCILLFCRSDGSAVEQMMSAMMERKSTETVQFVRQLTALPLDPDGVGLIIREQLDLFRRILEKGYSREKTLSVLQTAETFHAAGWKAFLNG